VSGPTVVVTPATFTLVDYDAERIAALVSEAAGWVGFDEADEIRMEIAEQMPTSQVSIVSVQPLVLAVEGGAFEDLKRPRKLSEVSVQTVAVRILARIGDRRRDGFGDAPAEGDLTVDQTDAWDAWALGRAAARGLAVAQPRWRYRFRNRHGFTDTADRVFDRLWAASDLTWEDLRAACAETAAARLAAAS